MFQKWRELAFLHWAWDPASLQRTLPDGLTIDTYDGKAYLGVVPFRMRDIRPRFLPAVPGISNFLEVNLRTYVRDQKGRSGVWFYSLDANQRLAVALARALFSLPYHAARMRVEDRDDGSRLYQSTRRSSPDARQSYEFTLHSNEREARGGSLEFFLVERYLLFAQTPAGLRVGQVHHRPYPIVDVELAAWNETLLSLNGFPPTGRAPDHVCGSHGVDVEVFSLEPA